MSNFKQQDNVYDTNNLEWGIGTVILVTYNTVKVKFDKLEKPIGYDKRTDKSLIYGVRPRDDRT